MQTWILIVAALIGIIAVFLLKGRGEQVEARPTEKRVVIGGISGSGKSRLFYTLAKGEAPTTVTSLKVCTSTFIAKGTGKKAEFVDIPGHEQFKRQGIAKLENASGWVYLVDSSQKDAIYKSALDLYDYFTYTKVQSLGIPLLIVANKQDATGAVDAEALEKNLKREIERIKRTRTAFTEESQGISDYLKSQSSAFDFEAVKGLRVSFGISSLTRNSFGDISEWLTSNIQL